MILKITVVLCATMLIVGAERGDRFPPYDMFRRMISPLEVKDETWYQDGAILKVIDGTFVVELFQSNSMPRSLVAEKKRIVKLNRGFARISSLNSLSLEDNFIERIDDLAFEGLPELISLNLARNRIKYLQKDSFQGLGKLEILNLNYNNLKESSLPSMDHFMLPSLQQLYLQHNQFGKKYLGPSGYEYPKFRLCHGNLKHLYLSNNSIRAFDKRGSFCLQNLTHLFLEDNEVYNPENALEYLQLQVLSLDGNNLHYIPPITQGLQFLSLARNHIGYINDFTNSEYLISLSLSHNDITVKEGIGITKNLPNLEYLDLDYNYLTESMPSNFFNSLTGLRILDLTGNKIYGHMNATLFAYLPNLEKLYLSNNRLKSFPGNQSCHENPLSYLDLSNNLIENLSDLELNMIPELKVLKINGNPLRRMDPHSVPSQLTILF